MAVNNLYDDTVVPATADPTQTSPILDPYTRGYMAQGIQQGQLYDIVTQQGYETEAQKRLGLLKEATLPTAQAELETGLRDVRSTMEKSGKLSSSAAIANQMRTSELYGARVASTMAQGALGIYEQLGTERSAEMQRMLESGKTATTLESQERLTKTGLASEEKIAQLQADTQTAIAQLQASTTLTGYEKEQQIAELNARTSKEITQIQTQSQEKIAEKEVGLGYAKLAQELSMFNTETTEGKRQFDLALEADMRKFNITTEQGATEFFAQLNWAKTQYGMDDKRIRELASNALSEQSREFDLTLEVDAEQFYANLRQAKELFGLEDDRIRDIETSRLFEMSREFDLTNANDMQKFYDTLQQNAELFYFDKQQTKDLAVMSLKEQSREFDLSQVNDMEKFHTNLMQQKELFGLEDDRIRDIATAAVTEQVREFDITNANDMVKFYDTIKQNGEQFNLSEANKMKIFTDTLEFQKEQQTDLATQNQIQMMLDIVKDTAVMSYFEDLAPDMLESMLIDISSTALTGEKINWTPEYFQTRLGQATAWKDYDVAFGESGAINANDFVKWANKNPKTAETIISNYTDRTGNNLPNFMKTWRNPETGKVAESTFTKQQQTDLAKVKTARESQPETNYPDKYYADIEKYIRLGYGYINAETKAGLDNGLLTKVK